MALAGLQYLSDVYPYRVMLQIAIPSKVVPKMIMNITVVFMLSLTLPRKKSIQLKILIIVNKLVNIPMIDSVSA